MATITYSQYIKLSKAERDSMFSNASAEDRKKIWDMIIANDKGNQSNLDRITSWGEEVWSDIWNEESGNDAIAKAKSTLLTPEEDSIIDRDIELKRISEVKNSLGQIGVSRTMEDDTAKLGTPESLNEPGLNPSFAYRAILDANSRGDMRLTPNNLQNVSNNLENRRGFNPNAYKSVGYQSEEHVPPIVTGPSKMGYQSSDHIPPNVTGPVKMGYQSSDHIPPNVTGNGMQTEYPITPSRVPGNKVQPEYPITPSRVPGNRVQPEYPITPSRVPGNRVQPIAGHPNVMAGTVPLPTSSIPQPRTIDNNNPNAEPQRPGYKVVKDGNNNPVKSGNGFMWSKDYQHKMWEN